MANKIGIYDNGTAAAVVVKLNEQIEIELGGRDVADCFWQLDSDEQAKFFDHLFSISVGELSMQLQYVTDSQRCTKEARRVMSLIGEYAPVQSDKEG